MLLPSIAKRGRGRKDLRIPPLLFLSYLAILLSPDSVAVDAKVVSGDVRLDGVNTEATLTKFALSPGAVGKLTLRVTSPDAYPDQTELRLRMYTDSEWPTVRKAPTCEQKVRSARKSVPVIFSRGDETLPGDDVPADPKLWTANLRNVTIPGDGSDRAQYWYFTLDDCRLEKYYHDPDVPRMSFRISLFDGMSADAGPGAAKYTHLPADEGGMARFHAVAAVFSLFLAAALGVRVFFSLTSGRGGASVHAVVLIVILACLCDALSSLCEIGHLRVYESDGVGSYSLDALSSHFEAVSDSSVAVVLLAVGSGWTLPSDVTSSSSYGGDGLLQRLLSGLRSPAGSICGLRSGSPAGVLAVAVFAAHAVLAQWGRTYDDDFDTYHALEHPPGRALMYLRAVLGAAFLAGVSSVRNGGRCPQSLRPFLTKFAIVGVSWFVSLPFVSMAIGGLVLPHLRHQALSVGAGVVQACSLTSLTWMFGAGRGASSYHQISRAGMGGKDNDEGYGDGGRDLTDLLTSSSSIGEENVMGLRKRHSAAGGGSSAPPIKAFMVGKAKIRLD